MTSALPSSRFSKGLVRCPHCDAGYDRESLASLGGKLYACVACMGQFVVDPQSLGAASAMQKQGLPTQQNDSLRDSQALPAKPSSALTPTRPAPNKVASAKVTRDTAKSIKKDSAQSPTAMIGRSIGPVEITAALGSGSAGFVYLGHNHDSGQDVAVKILPPKDAATELVRKRFEVTSALWQRLDHPNIIRVWDHGVRDNLSYILLEYVDGADVAHLLKGGHRFPAKRALQIAIQVLRGLDLAHQQGIVHGGVKPQNIIVRRDGVAKLGDFGLARARGKSKQKSSDTARLARESSYSTDLGGLTLLALRENPFAAPEVHAGEDGNARSDLYSLGVTLLVMLTGNNSDNFVNELVEHGSVGLSPLVRQSFPKELDEILRKLCALLPSERYATGEDAALAISHLLGTHCPADAACPQLPGLVCEASGMASREQDILQETAAVHTTTMSDIPKLLEKTGAGFDRGTSMRRMASGSRRAALIGAGLLVGFIVLVWILAGVLSGDEEPNSPTPGGTIAYNPPNQEDQPPRVPAPVIDEPDPVREPDPAPNKITHIDRLFDLCLLTAEGKLSDARAASRSLREEALSPEESLVLEGITAELRTLELQAREGREFQAELTLAELCAELGRINQGQAAMARASEIAANIPAEFALERLRLDDQLRAFQITFAQGSATRRALLTESLRERLEASDFAGAALALTDLAMLKPDAEKFSAAQSTIDAGVTEELAAIAALPAAASTPADAPEQPEEEDAAKAEPSDDEDDDENAQPPSDPAQPPAEGAAPQSTRPLAASPPRRAMTIAESAVSAAIDQAIRRIYALPLGGNGVSAATLQAAINEGLLPQASNAQRAELEAASVLIALRSAEPAAADRALAKMSQSDDQTASALQTELASMISTLREREDAWLSGRLSDASNAHTRLILRMRAALPLTDASVAWFGAEFERDLRFVQRLSERFAQAVEAGQPHLARALLSPLRELRQPTSLLEAQVPAQTDSATTLMDVWRSPHFCLLLIARGLALSSSLSESRSQRLQSADWALVPNADAELWPALARDIEAAQPASAMRATRIEISDTPALSIISSLDAMQGEAMPLPALPIFASVAPDGAHALLIYPGGSAAAWRLTSPRGEVASIAAHASAHSVSMGALGDLIALGGADGYLRLVRLPALREAATIPFGQSVELSALGPQGTWVAGVGGDGTLSVFSQADGRIRRSRQFSGGVSAISASPDGNWIAIIAGGVLHVLNTGTLETHVQRAVTGTHFADAAWSPCGGLIAASDEKGSVYLLTTGLAPVATLTVPSSRAQLHELRWKLDGRAIEASDATGERYTWLPGLSETR